MARPKKSVLVVEDDLDSRELLVELLTCEGYAVLTACDGNEALALLQRGPLPSVVVTDLMMPGMDGFGLIAAVRSHQRLKDLSVITFSAATYASLPRADAIVQKPEIDQLLACVKSLTASRSTRRGSSSSV